MLSLHADAVIAKSTPRDHLKPGRPARNEQERDRARAEIKSRYAQQRKDNNPHRRVALLRMPDIEKFCRASDLSDSGEWEFLSAAANHIAFIYRKTDAKVAAIVAWGRRFTPAIPTDRAKLLAERIVANPRLSTADKLARRLGLTMETRTALGITTIGAIDMSKAERAALRKKKNAEAHRLSRAAKSTGRPRGRPSKGKPWQALGISRRTYYRRGTKMRPQHSLSIHAADGISCHLPPQAATPPSTLSEASGSPTPQGA